MEKLVIGILAHVDAGKTTLTEAMLFRGGVLRRLGRVDHGDTFLDTDLIERERGITVFSKQAVLPLDGVEFQLLDTPGHRDLAAEAERTLPVLDYAILVISGTDGVQSHTRTLWRLLARYHVPVFLFINKQDLPGVERAAVMDELRSKLDGACVDFGAEGFHEEAATCGEQALEQFLAEGKIGDEQLRALIAARRLFPCFFGSALKLEGVDAFLAALRRYTARPTRPEEFGARVYKIARDPQGARLTYLKVTGGVLRVKDALTNRRAGLPPEELWEEKADQIRVYSGTRFQTVTQAEAGTVCAVTGLSRTRAGEGLGFEAGAAAPALEPVMTYKVLLPAEADPLAALRVLRLLEEEEPGLHVSWNDGLRELRLQTMGSVQLEVLTRQLKDRFDLDVCFDTGGIVYKETIAAPVEGVGHYEPLRHYAEVRLLLEPGERGSGLRFASDCPEEQLDRTWQRLVLSHLAERSPVGVLVGAPVTDVRITLVGGRGSVKHTEGGDFRQATWRAVQQGLMRAQSILLEPWYSFRLELPGESLGRALSDLQRMDAETEPPVTEGDEVILTGRAAVSAVGDYGAEVIAYTRGRGQLTLVFGGYAPCRQQEEVVAAVGYQPARDMDNPADSVFCAHGAGFVVPWDEVEQHAHVPSRRVGHAPVTPDTVGGGRMHTVSDSFAQDKELMAIFERTYGAVKPRDFLPKQERAIREGEDYRRDSRPVGPEYMLVDGYNILFALPELRALAQESLASARKLLMDLLSNYRGYRKCEVILVFDAYKVPHSVGSVENYAGIRVVYTKEAETADAYIEKATYALGPDKRVAVATSDGPEQLIILSHGARRMSAEALREELARTEGEIGEILRRTQRREGDGALRAALERAAGKQPPEPS